MRLYEQRLQDSTNDIAALRERNQQNLNELAIKDEDLVVLRVEVSNMQEKYKVKVEEVKFFVS